MNDLKVIKDFNEMNKSLYASYEDRIFNTEATIFYLAVDYLDYPNTKKNPNAELTEQNKKEFELLNSIKEYSFRYAEDISIKEADDYFNLKQQYIDIVESFDVNDTDIEQSVYASQFVKFYNDISKLFLFLRLAQINYENENFQISFMFYSLIEQTYTRLRYHKHYSDKDIINQILRDEDSLKIAKKHVNSKRGKKSAVTRYGDRVEQQKKFYYDLYVQRCKELKKSLPATKVAMWINNYHNEYDVEYEQILFHLRNAKKENKKTSV